MLLEWAVPYLRSAAALARCARNPRPRWHQFAIVVQYTRRRPIRRSASEPRPLLLLNVDVEAADPESIPLTHRLEEPDVIARPNMWTRPWPPSASLRPARLVTFGVSRRPRGTRRGDDSAPSRACRVVGSHHRGLSSRTRWRSDGNSVTCPRPRSTSSSGLRPIHADLAPKASMPSAVSLPNSAFCLAASSRAWRHRGPFIQIGS